VDEPGSKEARTTVKNLLRDGFSLYTVDIALAESLNAIWKHVIIHRDLKMEEAESTIHDLTRIYDAVSVIATRELSGEAVKIALTENMNIYDSVYVAAAMKLKATLITADKKLYDASKRMVPARTILVDSTSSKLESLEQEVRAEKRLQAV